MQRGKSTRSKTCFFTLEAHHIFVGSSFVSDELVAIARRDVLLLVTRRLRTLKAIGENAIPDAEHALNLGDAAGRRDPARPARGAATTRAATFILSKLRTRKRSAAVCALARQAFKALLQHKKVPRIYLLHIIAGRQGAWEYRPVVALGVLRL